MAVFFGYACTIYHVCGYFVSFSHIDIVYFCSYVSLLLSQVVWPIFVYLSLVTPKNKIVMPLNLENEVATILLGMMRSQKKVTYKE